MIQELSMDPRIKFMIEKAVDMEPTEKMTVAIDSLYVRMIIIPLQRGFRNPLRERRPLYDYESGCCNCCYRHSSSDDDE